MSQKTSVSRDSADARANQDFHVPSTRPGNLIGYARVSTADQTLDSQVRDLEAAGCARVFTDVASGAKSERPGLEEALGALQEGDTLLVWRLDRLGRSLGHLIQVVQELRERGVHFRSLRDGAIDTTTASGELVFHLFAALAQFERRLVRERTLAGLEAAQLQGRTGGRPSLQPGDPRVLAAQRMRADGMPATSIGRALGIGRYTVYRYLRLTG